MFINNMQRILVSLLTLAMLSNLSGCAVVAVGAVGATAVTVSNDRRTAGTQLDDFNARRKAAGVIANDDTISANSNIEITLYNGVALLTGQAPDQTTIRKAESLVKSVDYIRKIHNQIRVAEPLPASSVLHDKWLATKIRTKILGSDNVPGSQINIIVEDSEVFLMGLVTNQEATAAVDIARHVDGVSRVVRAFEIY